MTQACPDELYKSVQENSSPALWSQGVTLTRGQTRFLTSRQDASETVIHLQIQNQPVSPKVTLWPEQEDWDCDCGSPQSPCAHVVAALIAWKRGLLSAAQSSSQSGVGEIHYRLEPGPSGLSLRRVLQASGGEREMRESLSAYLGGVQSGRLTGPALLATKADHHLESALGAYRWGTPLDRARLEALFKSYEVDLKIFLRGKRIELSTEILSVRAECVDEAGGYRLRKIQNTSITEIFPQGVALCGQTLKLIAPTRLTPEDNRLIGGEGTFFPAESERRLRGEVLPALQKKIPVDIRSLKLPQVMEVAPRIDLLLEKEGADLSVLANLVYGDPPLLQLHPQTLDLVPVKDRSTRLNQVIKRDLVLERQLLAKLGRELSLQVGRRVLLPGLSAQDFVQKLSDWEHRGVDLGFLQPQSRVLRPELKINPPRFEVEFVSPAGGEVSFEKVVQAWASGEDSVPLLDGQWAQIPKDFLSQHARRLEEFLQARNAQKELAPSRLPELVELCRELGQEVPDALAPLRRLSEDFSGIPDAPLPPDLCAELRSYQRQGVNWLCFLRQGRMGALLADDMGLGKTLQTLCALRGRTLVVAPTSVVFNWAAEIEKFRPSLKAALYYGPGRVLTRDQQVVLTTYGVLRLDQEILAAENWDTIVLDEGHTIKNPESQVARAAHRLRAPFKISLSGTPVENRLDDLWSQFQFINPGLLGSRESFAEHFARPILRGEKEVAERLRRRLKPFILRRLKREVAPELPPRTETVLHCELGPEERSTYEMLLASTRKEVLAKLAEGQSVMKALELILRLRQACCHPALLPGLSDPPRRSSKLDLLLETLEESLSEGHKCLVFSQWTSFLDLISRELTERGVSHSRIDGSTTNRAQVVKDFQLPGGPPVMLISLKAGGVGLTLTAADQVFIMDPWWNPAAEDQAADRAHRIGQENPVLIHRLVARESIEERILALQARKKDLARAVLEEGAAQGALSLSREDLLELLS